MAGPAPGEQERVRNTNTNIRGKLLRAAGLATFTAKAIAGGIEAAPTSNQVANSGSDRPGISANIPSHSINTLGRLDDGSKNPSISKATGKTAGASSVAGISSIPSPAIEGKYTGDHSQGDHGARQVVFKNTRDGKDIGPKSENIAAWRATAGSDWSASPKLIDKTQASQPQSDKNVNLPPFGETYEVIKEFAGQAAEWMINAIGSGGFLASCARFLPETQTGTVTPTISPITPDDEAQFAKEMIAKTTNSKVDFRTLTSREQLLFKYVGAISDALRTSVGDKQISNYKITMPISDKAFDHWEATGIEPAHILENIKTGEKLTVVASKYWKDIHLQNVSPRALIGITDEGLSNIVLPKGGINEYTGKEWGVRYFMTKAAMFLDTSEYPLGDPRITVQLTPELLDILYRHSMERQKADPSAESTLVPHLDTQGVLQFTVVERNKTSKRISQMGSDKRLYNPDEEALRLEKKKPIDRDGKIIIQVEGSGVNAGEWYDFGVYSPSQNAVVENTPTPTKVAPSPTVAPTETPKPTPTLTEQEKMEQVIEQYAAAGRIQMETAEQNEIIEKDLKTTIPEFLRYIKKFSESDRPDPRINHKLEELYQKHPELPPLSEIFKALIGNEAELFKNIPRWPYSVVIKPLQSHRPQNAVCYFEIDRSGRYIELRTSRFFDPNWEKKARDGARQGCMMKEMLGLNLNPILYNRFRLENSMPISDHLSDAFRAVYMSDYKERHGINDALYDGHLNTAINYIAKW